MKLYNTLTRQIEEFKPAVDKQITMYSCGPTVYDRLHVGNWSSYIRWDTLVRTLKLSGYDIRRVINITDVGHLVSDADEGEDKLEKGARREGKSAWEIARLYTDDFKAGMHALNLLPPEIYAIATEHMPEQIDLIKKLETKGFTYKISDGIYFDISKFPTYADFAKLDLKDQKTGARFTPNPQKRQPQDFALWKFSPAGHKRDMEWDSPWGKGFPGWHLECSAMALKYLGETIDIHTGGIDHIPVHHTNEIAQSEAATGKRFVNFWLHNNFMLVDDSKISKSLRNGITLQDISENGFSAMDLKMLVLQSHYRSETHFSWDNLRAAKSRLGSYRAMADMVWQPAEDAQEAAGRYARQADMQAALQNDLDTPTALSLLSAIADDINTNLISEEEAGSLSEFLSYLDEAFGLDLSKREDISDEQKTLITRRESARHRNNWGESDKIRTELAAQGIELNDTAKGTVWSKI